jgi:hypothetical protein
MQQDTARSGKAQQVAPLVVEIKAAIERLAAARSASAMLKAS